MYKALTEGKADAALAASILHYGVYSVSQAKEYLDKKRIPVRPIEDPMEDITGEIKP